MRTSYKRINGWTRPKTGNYNDFWDKRNYVKDAKNVKASVFVVHGLNDWNVKTKQFAQWWEALAENNVPRKMWLHQGGHGGTSSNNWQQTQNKWLDYWLYGIENGIMDEPMVDVQRENKTWQKIKIGQIQQLYLQKSVCI